MTSTQRNLVGLLADSPAPWTRRRLVRLVSGTDPLALLLTLVGGRRQQLRTRLDDETIRAAVAGDAAAQRQLRATVADTLLQINPWLLRTDSREVKETCVRVLESMPRLDARAPATQGCSDSLAARILWQRRRAFSGVAGVAIQRRFSRTSAAAWPSAEASKNRSG